MPINRQNIITDFTAPQKAEIIADTVTRFDAKRIILKNRALVKTDPTLVSILEVNHLAKDTDGDPVLPAKVYPIKAPYLS